LATVSEEEREEEEEEEEEEFVRGKDSLLACTFWEEP